MARLKEDRYFDTEAEALHFQRVYLDNWAGAFNPYDGTATLVPPNDDRPQWLVIASRNSSAD